MEQLKLFDPDSFLKLTEEKKYEEYISQSELLFNFQELYNKYLDVAIDQLVEIDTLKEKIREMEGLYEEEAKQTV